MKLKLSEKIFIYTMIVIGVAIYQLVDHLKLPAIDAIDKEKKRESSSHLSTTYKPTPSLSF